MRENYYALCLSVIYGYNADVAFKVMGGTNKGFHRNNNATVDKDIFEMRQSGDTNRQIGEYFGMSIHTISERYNRYLKGLRKEKLANEY